MTAVIEPMDGLPVAGAIRRSSEPVDLRGSMAELSVAHEVEADAALDGLTAGRRVGEVSLAFVRYGAPVRVLAWATGTKVCWTVPVGPMGVRVGSEEHTLGAGFLLAPGSTTVMHPDPEQGAVVVTTEARTLADRFETLTGRRPTGELVIDPFAASVNEGQIDHAVRYESSVLESTPAPGAALARTLQDCLVTALLLEAPTNYAAELAAGRPLSLEERRLEAARRWAAEHLDDDFDMADWAAGVGMSVRRLQVLTRETAGVTPWQLVTRMRLERARDLLRSGSAASVTDAALAAGFGHLGRFAAAYREAFGVPPSQDRH